MNIVEQWLAFWIYIFLNMNWDDEEVKIWKILKDSFDLYCLNQAKIYELVAGVTKVSYIFEHNNLKLSYCT